VRTVAEMAQPRRREPRGGVSRSFRCRVYLFCTEILEVRPPARDTSATTPSKTSSSPGANWTRRSEGSGWIKSS